MSKLFEKARRAALTARANAELRQFADYDEDELGSDRAAEILQTMDRLLLIVEGVLAEQGGT